VPGRKRKRGEQSQYANKTCDGEECTKRPSYAYEGEKQARRCAKCSDVSMIDIKSKRCAIANCTAYATYGYPGNKKTLCSTHKKSGMIKNSTKPCEENQCNNLAIYGFKEAKWCETHRHEKSVNLIEKECSTVIFLMYSALMGCAKIAAHGHTLHEYALESSTKCNNG